MAIITKFQMFLFFYGENASEEKNDVKSLNEGVCSKSSKSFFTSCKSHLSIYTILHSLEATQDLLNE